MPDTGAPWNIPYAQASNLVRDWPALSEDIAEAVADGLDIATLGLGKNVVQTVKTDTFSTTSGTFTDVTGLSATITPAIATSKVLVTCAFAVGASATQNTAFRFLRGSTAIGVGAAAGSRPQAGGQFTVPAANYRGIMVMQFLDSPGVATATEYKVQCLIDGGTTLYVGRGSTDADAATASSARTSSTLTLIEVAA